MSSEFEKGSDPSGSEVPEHARFAVALAPLNRRGLTPFRNYYYNVYKSRLSASAITVTLDFGSQSFTVGQLRLIQRQVHFQYDPTFLEMGIPLSPIRLPLSSQPYTFNHDLFDGLPGVFYDSLPDGWGQLLLDRSLRQKGLSLHQLTVLDRLTLVGVNGMGALRYEPDHTARTMPSPIDLDRLSDTCQAIYQGNPNDFIEEMLALNGSSAGARPKASIGVSKDKHTLISDPFSEEFEPWIVKFSNAQDGHDSGKIEYIYNQMAKEAGLRISPFHLFQTNAGNTYFATRRFDRTANTRVHMHTPCGLLHSNFRVPALDYADLIKLTYQLTQNIQEVEMMFRYAVFNVLAHNRDDHGKNFSFLMDEKGQWTLSPVYDLTFSFGPGGEQSTMVMGEGKSPSISHLLDLAKLAGLTPQKANAIISDTQNALAKWTTLARQLDLDSSRILDISKLIV